MTTPPALPPDPFAPAPAAPPREPDLPDPALPPTDPFAPGPAPAPAPVPPPPGPPLDWEGKPMSDLPGRAIRRFQAAAAEQGIRPAGPR